MHNQRRKKKKLHPNAAFMMRGCLPDDLEEAGSSSDPSRVSAAGNLFSALTFTVDGSSQLSSEQNPCNQHYIHKILHVINRYETALTVTTNSD